MGRLKKIMKKISILIIAITLVVATLFITASNARADPEPYYHGATQSKRLF